MIRVLIADDHAVVRKGLVKIVAEETNMVVVGEAVNGPEVLQSVHRQPPDVLVLDVNMPGRSGLEVLREVKQLHPRLPVLMLSVHPEDQLAVRALMAGASGYLNKDSAPDEMVEAIRKVFQGGGCGAETPAGRHREASPNSLRSRVFRTVADRRWKNALSNRRTTLRQRKIRQHLPCPDSQKNANANQRRADALRHSQPPGRVSSLVL